MYSLGIIYGDDFMTTITFNTLKLVDKLKAVGIHQEQAEALWYGLLLKRKMSWLLKPILILSCLLSLPILPCSSG